MTNSPAEIGSTARALNAYALTKGTHTQKLEAALKAANPNPPQLPVFKEVLALWECTYSDAPECDAKKTRRALAMAWWFIENVTEDTPDRTDIFFELRPLIRQGL